MAGFVLDSYALLEWLLGQPKADAVERYLQDSAAGQIQLAMSWINAGEVSYMLARKRGEKAAEEFVRRVPSLPVRMVLPGIESILAAARIKARGKLAYADAFAVELAVAEKSRIVTGDPEIRALGLAPVVWIGPETAGGAKREPRNW